MLLEQIASLSTEHVSGEPGNDAMNSLDPQQSTWKLSAPLIQVYGVERSMYDINPNERDIFSLVMDASATDVFGLQDANVVRSFTTKQDRVRKTKLSFTTSARIIAPSESSNVANSYQYATFFNQINTGVGLNPSFSDERRQKFKAGSIPLLFPCVEWGYYCFKDITRQTLRNVNISGGTVRVRYFITAGAYTQGGLFKAFVLPLNLSYLYNHFFYRSYLDIDVTKTTTLLMIIVDYVNNASKPYTDHVSAWMLINIFSSTPVSRPGLVDDKRVNPIPD